MNKKHMISQIPTSEIDTLIAEEKLLRLLNPNIRANVEATLDQVADASQYVVQCKGELYLSLTHIPDPQQRHQLYSLVQRYQTGEKVNLNKLPEGMRGLLQPKLTRLGRLFGSILLGGFVGLGSGVLGMAVCILIINLLELLLPTVTSEFAGMSITAATFIILVTLGWTAGTFVSWQRLQQWPNVTDTVNFRRKLFEPTED